MKAICPNCGQEVVVIGGFILRYDTHPSGKYFQDICGMSNGKIVPGSVVIDNET